MLIRLGGLFFVLMAILWLYALFDALTSEPSKVRNLPKIGWVVIVLIGFEIGAVAWFLLGRPKNQALMPGPGRAMPPTRGSGPVGPDDDPDFLKGI
jgi:hypothetical protein